MNQWIKKLIRKLFFWAMQDELIEIASKSNDIATAVAKRVSEKVVLDKLNAAQAIEYGGKHDTGKIILITSVNGHDVIKFFDIPRNMNLKDYNEVSSYIKYVYGAKVKFFDGPPGFKDAWGRMYLDL